MFLAMAVFGVWTASVRGDAFYADTPIAVSILKTFPDDAEVCGLHLSPIALDAPYSVVGLSLGGFWAQKLRGRRKLLVNPDFHPSRLLRSKLGVMEYLSPRRDGATSFTITEEICRGYEALENVEFEGIDAQETALTTGMFADHDEMVDCHDEFLAHYPGRAHRYPGTHLPNFPEIKKYFLPVIENEISHE